MSGSYQFSGLFVAFSVSKTVILAKRSSQLCEAGNSVSTTGRERLIRSHSSARFSFELSGNLN